MSQACNSAIPTDRVKRYRDELERLADSDLPVSDYASRLLELLDQDERT